VSSRNTSHLAGEFLVAGELSRRGYPVSITFGNAKSVDIYADTADTHKKTIKVDAKAGRKKGNWPIQKSSVIADVYYIFVHLQSTTRIKKKKAPEYFIVPGKDILSKNLIERWKSREGIRYSTLNKNDEYKERWDRLPQPLI
jgi:hypothetical protein